MPRLMACSHSADDPASRFRILQYVPHLAAAGWEVSHRPNRPARHWRPRLPRGPLRSIERRMGLARRRANRLRDVRDAAAFDAVLLNRDLLDGAVIWEERLFAANPRVVFDFDDAIYLGPEREAHVGWICSHAAWVTPGNETLAAFARRFTERVTMIPSTVPVERYEPHPASLGAAPTGPARVGWLGSDLSIRQTLFPAWAMLGRLQRELGFEMVVCSRPRPEPPAGGPTWRYLEWAPDVEERIARHVDVGIMPLVDDEYQRGKCGMKLLQYMAAGLPVVASPVGANTEIVVPGGTGFLAATESEWRAALTALVADAGLRGAFGREGRERCERDYATRLWAPRLAEILARVAA